MTRVVLGLWTLGCGEDERAWWETDRPCPEGTELLGTPYSEDAEEPLPHFEVFCAPEDRPPERQGPSTAWHRSGQLAVEGRWEKGQPVESTSWYEDGRVRAVLSEGIWTHTWWHHQGPRALEGGTNTSHLPHGEWVEWDESGAEIGRVTWTEGVAGEPSGSSTLVLYAEQASQLGTTALGQSFDDLDLPSSTSTVSPPLAVNLVVEEGRIVVDGLALVDLEDSRIPDRSKRGTLVQPLFDTLLEKAEAWKDLDRIAGGSGEAPTVLIAATASTSWSVMREILYTAGQASFSSFHFLTRVEGLQWPPRSGPEADRGGAVLAVLEMTLPSLGPPNEEDREPAPVVRLPAEIPAGGGQLLVIAPAQESTHAQVCAAMDEARNKGWAGTTLAGGRP